jgi:hypothetical protein
MDAWAGKGKMFLSSTLLRLVLAQTQRSIQWAPGDTYPGSNAVGAEANRPLPDNVRDKNTRIYISIHTS